MAVVLGTGQCRLLQQGGWKRRYQWLHQEGWKTREQEDKPDIYTRFRTSNQTRGFVRFQHSGIYTLCSGIYTLYSGIYTLYKKSLCVESVEHSLLNTRFSSFTRKFIRKLESFTYIRLANLMFYIFSETWQKHSCKRYCKIFNILHLFGFKLR